MKNMIFMERNRFIYAVVLITALIFSSCDTYSTRKKLVAELSSLYNKNHTEFDKIQEYFLSDSLSRGLVFRYQDGKIGIGVNGNSTTLDSISQIKDNPTVYEILTFMRKKGIRTIYGNGSGYNKKAWIIIFFEDFNPHCNYPLITLTNSVALFLSFSNFGTTDFFRTNGACR